MARFAAAERSCGANERNELTRRLDEALAKLDPVLLELPACERPPERPRGRGR